MGVEWHALERDGLRWGWRHIRAWVRVEEGGRSVRREEQLENATPALTKFFSHHSLPVQTNHKLKQSERWRQLSRRQGSCERGWRKRS